VLILNLYYKWRAVKSMPWRLRAQEGTPVPMEWDTVWGPPPVSKNTYLEELKERHSLHVGDQHYSRRYRSRVCTCRRGSTNWLKTGPVTGCCRHGNEHVDAVAFNSVIGWVNMSFLYVTLFYGIG
jgi:hypothetical protein